MPDLLEQHNVLCVRTRSLPQESAIRVFSIARPYVANVRCAEGFSQFAACYSIDEGTIDVVVCHTAPNCVAGQYRFNCSLTALFRQADKSTLMSDDDELPFYAPNKKPAPERKPQPGAELWRLRMDDRVITCELRDDDRVGAGWDVQLFEGGALRASRRCVDWNGARLVAESYRQDLIRTGWTEYRA